LVFSKPFRSNALQIFCAFISRIQENASPSPSAKSIDRNQNPLTSFPRQGFDRIRATFPAPEVRPDTSTDYRLMRPHDKRIVAPRQLMQFLPAPTERHDTSIARQGYDPPHRTFSGLKDRWIYARMTVFKPFTPSHF